MGDAEHWYQTFDPLMADEDAASMVTLCERFGTYTTYDVEQSDVDFGGLAQRYDAAGNFVRTGGRFGRQDEGRSQLAARTNYFREEYAYGDEVLAPGIEPFLRHEGLMEAARELHGRPVIEPSIVYANMMLPGQELAVHTDVPEFRGANRRRYPQWLMVVMHHSGLFDVWRMPIATGISYFGECEAGELAFYPDGAEGPPRTIPVKHNTAILLDTDTVFHGVDRVGGGDADVVDLPVGASLAPLASGRWRLGDPSGETVAEFGWADLRFSVSWKAYCFVDDAERHAWRHHADDLELAPILDRLEEDLRQRGVLSGDRPDDRDFALLLIDTYVKFPAPAT